MVGLPLQREKNTTFDLALSFGNSEAASLKEGQASLNQGYQKVLAAYNGDGAAIGWQDYLASLEPLSTPPSATVSDWMTSTCRHRRPEPVR